MCFSVIIYLLQHRLLPLIDPGNRVKKEQELLSQFPFTPDAALMLSERIPPTREI